MVLTNVYRLGWTQNSCFNRKQTVEQIVCHVIIDWETPVKMLRDVIKSGAPGVRCWGWWMPEGVVRCDILLFPHPSLLSCLRIWSFVCQTQSQNNYSKKADCVDTIIWLCNCDVIQLLLRPLSVVYATRLRRQ